MLKKIILENSDRKILQLEEHETGEWDLYLWGIHQFCSLL